MKFSRRQLLAMAAASAALPATRAFGFGQPTRLDIAELDVGQGSLSRPNAWRRLLYELDQTTSVETEPVSTLVAPDSEELFNHPFCVLIGDGPFEPLSEAAIERLTQYLAYGGFLFLDDASGGTSDGFDLSVKRLLRRVFPTRQLTILPGDHSVNRSFFLLRGCPGRVDTSRSLLGITEGNLSPVVYCRNDISGALDRTDTGRDVNACIPGGERQRREATKLGINLVMYSLTANYKNDQAHVRKLMMERRIE